MITTELGSNVEDYTTGTVKNITNQDATKTRYNKDVTEETPTKLSYLSLS